MSGKLKTLGISPKVANPTLALIAVGVAALVVGHFLHDPVLRAIGVSLLGAAGVIVAPVGFQSSPGTIVGGVDAVVTTVERQNPELASAIATAKQQVEAANRVVQGLTSVPDLAPPTPTEGPHAA